MKQALTNAPIFTGDEWLDGRALLLDGAHIEAIVPASDVPSGYEVADLSGRRLVPGLIDTQVNGGGGVLFNDAPSVKTLRTLGEAHRRYGTTGFLPTLISDDLSVVEAAIAAVRQALAEKVPGVLGIHLEGPFLNPARKGVHDEEKFRRLTPETVTLLSSLETGFTLVTLADRKSVV